MRKFAVLLLLVLAGCATPVTTLSNKGGDVVTCGGGTAGSVAGGFIGYRMQEDNDRACVDAFKAKGYHIN